jgi:aspartyl protease family protein
MRLIISLVGLILALAGFLLRHAEQLGLPPIPPVPQLAASLATTTGAEAASGGRSVVVPRGPSGHFQIEARVDGRHIRFVVDTGATSIALRESDAARVGLRPSARDYTVQISTANGMTRGAPVKLHMVDVGGVVVRDVSAIVQPDNVLPHNLLGMAFLSRVRWSYNNGRFALEQ